MALFPKGGMYGFSQKDIDIQKQMESFYTNNFSINQVFWAEADMDTRFEAGDQSVYYELYDLNRNTQSLVFNRIKRVTNMISGYQRRNRKSTIVIPVENADEETASQFTKVLSWADRQESILYTISDAFHGSIVTGLSLLHIWIDYRNDPKSGDIRVDNCSYNSFLMDPFFKKKDLSDCDAIWKRSYLKPEQISSLLPQYKKKIKAMNNVDGDDGKFGYLPETFMTNKNELYSYDEYYYRTFRKQKMLIDSDSGEVLEWSGQDDERLKLFLAQNPTVIMQEQTIPTVNLAILVQGKLLYDGRNPSGTDRYPFVPVFGYFNPQLSNFEARIQGVVRGLRDAQWVYNRRKQIELEVAESKATTGYIVKAGATIDPMEPYKTGQGRTITLKETAEMTDIMAIQTQEVPQSFFQLSQIIGQEIQEISGVNEELLGSATDDKAGILSQLRQGAGLTTLMGLFDQLDMSQKLVGQLMIEMIQANFMPGKIKRIIEDEPSPQFYNKAFGRYDAAVEEGLNTTTQRQMQFAQLLHLKEIGVPIPDSVLIEAATIQDKKKLIEAIEQQNQQAAQAQQAQMESELKEQSARIDLAYARADADRSLGAERVSRIAENQAMVPERLAEAEKDRAQADLNIARAAQEIETVDIDQILKLLSFIQTIKQQEKVVSPNTIS